MTRFLRRAAALLAALMLIAITATVVFGADVTLLGGKLQAGQTVTISEPWDGNLYLFAGQVTVDGDGTGDLVAFGGTINVNGTVTGDVLVAGGRVQLAGDVDGDIRAAGGQVEMTGSATGDVLVTGGQVRLISGSSVGGDVIVSGGQVTVDGDVDGSVVGTAGQYSSSGVIGGENNVQVAENQPTDSVAVSGLRQFLVVIVVGGLMLLFVPRVLEAADTSLRTSPVGSFVGGLLTCLGYFVFVVVATLLTILLAIIFVVVLLGPLAAFSILGGILAVGVVSYLFLLAVLYLADVVVALGLAHVVSRPGPDESRWRELLLLVIGAVVVVVLTALPVVGGLAKLLVVLFGLGALAYAWWQSRKKGDIGPASVPAEPPPAPAPPAAG